MTTWFCGWSIAGGRLFRQRSDNGRRHRRADENHDSPLPCQPTTLGNSDLTDHRLTQTAICLRHGARSASSTATSTISGNAAGTHPGIQQRSQRGRNGDHLVPERGDINITGRGGQTWAVRGLLLQWSRQFDQAPVPHAGTITLDGQAGGGASTGGSQRDRDDDLQHRGHHQCGWRHHDHWNRQCDGTSNGQLWHPHRRHRPYRIDREPEPTQRTSLMDGTAGNGRRGITRGLRIRLRPSCVAPKARYHPDRRGVGNEVPPLHCQQRRDDLVTEHNRTGRLRAHLDDRRHGRRGHSRPVFGMVSNSQYSLDRHRFDRHHSRSRPEPVPTFALTSWVTTIYG